MDLDLSWPAGLALVPQLPLRAKSASKNQPEAKGTEYAKETRSLSTLLGACFLKFNNMAFYYFTCFLGF